MVLLDIVPVEKFTVRMPMMGLELALLGYKPSAPAIELNSSIAITGKELVYCITV